LGEEDPATRAATIGAWLIGLMLVLPPLPIWMALLYQRNSAAHDGADLGQKVDAWLRLDTEPDQTVSLQPEGNPRTIRET
jgi:hypothetical protein